MVYTKYFKLVAETSLAVEIIGSYYNKVPTIFKIKIKPVYPFSKT